jgi:hypothetical protein
MERWKLNGFRRFFTIEPGLIGHQVCVEPPKMALYLREASAEKFRRWAARFEPCFT